MSCRYNNFLDVGSTGVLRIHRAEQTAESSCALDLSADGPVEQLAVAAILNVTPERVRKIERGYERKLREGPDGQLLLELLDAVRSQSPAEPAWPEGDSGPMRWFGESEAPSTEVEIEQWSTRAAALMLAGLPARAAWSVAGWEPDEEEEDDMAAKKAAKAKLATERREGARAASGGEETMIGKPFTGRQPVPIDPVRRAKVSEELVKVLGKIDDVNEERSAAIGGFNGQLKELRQKQHELAEAHRTSTEKRDVKCALFLLPGEEVVTRRLDTKEIVERRTATAEELEQIQTKAFDEEHVGRKVAHKRLVETLGDEASS